MLCPKCGAGVSGSGTFCPACGTKIEAPVQPEPVYVPKHAAPEPARPSAVTPPVWDSVQYSAPAAEPVRSHGRSCPNCGRPAEEGIAFCGGCGYRFAAPAQPSQPRKEKKYSAVAKSSKVWVSIVSAVALLLVAALVIGILSMAGGPLVKIGSAVQKTVKAGNFTADYEVEIDGQSVEGTMYADIDTKDRTVSMYTVIESGYMELTFGIYDGYLFMLTSYSGYSYGYAQDIEDALDEIFDAYEESGSGDTAELLEQINDLVYEYTGEELSDYFDLDELDVCMKAFAREASKEKWLKTNLGYEKTKKNGETLYTFVPNLYDFLMVSLPYFEDAFEDSDMYDDLMDSLEDMEDYLDDDVEMEYTIGVKSGYISSANIVMDMDGDEVEISVKIYDVNKTKLDEADLADLLEEAEKYSR